MRIAKRFLVLLALLLAGLGAALPASAQTRVVPYLEVQQVLDVDFDDGDVLTYTALAAGIDGTVTTRRFETQLSYRYERRIPWDADLNREDVHSGLARARFDLMPDTLSLESGAIAMRMRGDIRGDGVGFSTSDSRNLTQLYGIYAGPSFATRTGDLAVNADYRFGHVRAESDDVVVLGGGQVPLDRYDRATSHDLSGRVGMAPRTLAPFGWSLSAGLQRENASQLKQRYTGRYVRLDITQPVSRTVALTGGIGHEYIRITQRAALPDASGLPVIDRRGRFVTDPASPRLLAYNTDGLIWDVGVIWKPSRRTTLEARGGRRYGDYAFTATLDHQIGPRSALRIGVFDAVDSFGRALTRNLSGLPIRFRNGNDPLGGGLGACVFGEEPGSGSCFGDALQSVTTANYRTRGVSVLFSGEKGPWRYGLGGAYVAHKFLAPDNGPGLSLSGLNDRSFSIEANADRRLTDASGVTGSVYADWYKGGFANSGEVVEVGAGLSYYRRFSRHILGRAAAGLYTTRFEGRGSDTRGQFLAGVRYEF